ncbi:amino acid ABC transporter ATP-binding protein [Lacticaseibacillus thailandensis]|uniref:Amino acid abc transporter, atp-binding protein n=1 Tax=Lacticaseibacillus thailandensis DSM 22698 = JCM 13996 TaxID=1423810 RepID=A0A0R2CF55_9LACO|nr:amino acid ABC transporter ATP-binding protein [Lacticaseibacillus thailandensis]KRM86971.1 amino acid abc transporter, atp-binding protein [Lacticaseibacillus thailandensis DSM 22698 = JCM 13996]
MIKIEHLNKQFGDHAALKDVSLEFPEHQTTVILGPSGSGKSTLLRSLDLLERPESGHFAFDQTQIDYSQPISESTVLDVRRRTEMVFQQFNLFPHLTVLQNVIEGPVHVLKQDAAAATKRAQELLGKVGLADKADAYPSALSGGQAQRVAIARSLAMRPEYIFLDEPTSALDPELELGVLKVLLQIAREQQSMIIVTHNMAFAQKVADKIVFLENGNIEFDGSSDAFFHTDNQRIRNFVSAMTFATLE